MNFEFSPEDEAFRAEVREFIRVNLPSRSRATRAGGGIPKWRISALAAHSRGPRLGARIGRSNTVVRTGAPFAGTSSWRKSTGRMHPISSAGTHMLAPVLIAFGSAQLNSRFLPKILTGEESCARDFRNPARLRLANLRTAATLEDGHYIINGQKIWTSDGAGIRLGILPGQNRSTVKPQRGLSFIVTRMDAPGIRVRPIAPSMGAGS